MDINYTETFKAKLVFKRDCNSKWVVIKECHTDNMLFNASDFMEDILKNQKILVLVGMVPQIKIGH